MQAVSAGHEVTMEVAKLILDEGGNAFDAAVAAYAASWIAEPCMSSVGGGAFATIFTKDREAFIYDFFCQTPKSKNLKTEANFIPIHVDFGEVHELYYGGMASLAVPGSVSGIFAIHERFGKMPMRTLLEPAIKLAKKGVPINNFQHYDLFLLQSIFHSTKRAKELFQTDGSLIKVGHNFRLPHLADFMDYLSKEGPDAFYKGEVAKQLISDCKETGGYLSSEDLQSYKTIIRAPLKIPFRGFQILTNPLPSTGGALMAVGLDYLEHIKDEINGNNILEAFQKMDLFEKDPNRLGKFLKKRNRRGATSHFSIVDRWGNSIALTMTLGEGSGYLIPGTDIHMNNMLGESALVPKGWHSWLEDIRLSSMMAPSIAIDSYGKPKLVIGSGGASRIAGALLQLMINILEKNLSLEKAVAAPRMHFEDGKLNLEPGFEIDQKEIEKNIECIKWEKQSMFFGGTHGIKIEEDHLESIGDQRRDGVGIAF